MRELIKTALAEDIGRGDLYSLIGDNAVKSATITCKDEGVFAGEIYLREICLMQGIELTMFVKDGDKIGYKDKIAELKAPLSILLASERTMLNFIQHASGIATKTAAFVAQTQGSNVRVLDTRKTRPGLRVLEKYAVRCGGGSNHRMGLDDALMMKDTHLRGVSDLGEFIKNARKKLPFTTKIEVECDTFEEVKNCMKAGVDIVMCDNMSVEQIKEIVKFRDEFYPSVLLEASGNISLKTIREYAFSGVDVVSTGSTIHQAVWLDFSMRLSE